MKKWILITTLVVVALVAAIVLVPAVLADGPTNGYGPGYGQGPLFNSDSGFGYGRGLMSNRNFGPGSRMGRGNAAGPLFGLGSRWGGPDNSLIAVAAEQLGLSQADLIAELQSGKTIADVAAAHEVALETIVDTFLAPRAERLAELVANNQLSQEQADAMLATMKANVTARLSEPWSPQGAGPGRGPGFVDEDGDGLCDYAGSGGQHLGRRGGAMGHWGQ